MLETVKSHECARSVAGCGVGWLPAARGSRHAVPSRLVDSVLAHGVLARQLASHAGFMPGERALHLGCGTGDLLFTLAEMYPASSLHGLESNRQDLEIACRRSNPAHRRVEFRRGLVVAPSYPPSSFHHVVLTPLLRGLSAGEKRRALEVSCRLLKPGGFIHTVDWGRPPGTPIRWGRAILLWVCGLSAAGGRTAGAEIARAGFASVRMIHEVSRTVGTVAVYRAQRDRRSEY